jgi:hypothetical protein
VGRDVKVIVLGQDPRVQRRESQAKIRHVLSLGESQAPLDRFVVKIVSGISSSPRLGRDNIFGLNLVDRLYDHKPTEEEVWTDGNKSIDHVRRKLEPFAPFVPLVSLGQPVLRVLANDRRVKLRDLWGYENPARPADSRKFRHLGPAHNVLGRHVFPFPHINSYQRKNSDFYRRTFDDYIRFCSSVVGLD